MSHLNNEIQQLESVLNNVRREQSAAVARLRAAAESQQTAANARANAELEVERLKETVGSLVQSLSVLRSLNADRPGATVSGGGAP